jgi:hypothetical protein
MQARYLGDALPIPSGSVVQVVVEAEVVTITHSNQVLTLPRAGLTARIEKRLTFDPRTRRRGPTLFGGLNMAERRGEPSLVDVAHLDTPNGPIILAIENVQSFVETFTHSRQTAIASAVPLRERRVRQLIAIAILVLVALIIAVISTRPNLH